MDVARQRAPETSSAVKPLPPLRERKKWDYRNVIHPPLETE
jgi:hypothetical protein